MINKICTKCKEPKLLKEFYSDKQNSWCKLCIKLTMRYYRKKYPWKTRYHSIKQRCNSPKNPYYKNYGGRGIKCLITVDEIKKLWFRDKAFNMKIPSIDRKDNDGNYCLENCRFIEKSENSAKANRESKIKSVNQYDLDGKFIKTWRGVREIERILGFDNGNVSRVCNGGRKTANGFIWRFKNVK